MTTCDQRSACHPERGEGSKAFLLRSTLAAEDRTSRCSIRSGRFANRPYLGGRETSGWGDQLRTQTVFPAKGSPEPVERAGIQKSAFYRHLAVCSEIGAIGRLHGGS